MQTPLQQVEVYCEKRGIQLTQKRKQVLDVLVQSGKALSAYTLASIFQERFGKVIPAMSVYRILDFLKKERLVHKLEIANKYVACSHFDDDGCQGVTQFLICQNCDKFQEIHIEPKTIAILNDNACGVGFTPVNSHLEMSCVCKNCDKKPS